MIKEIFYKEISELASKAYEMTDELFAEKCIELFAKLKQTDANTSAIDKIIAKRVQTYCMLNKMSIDEYDGPLPWKIATITEKQDDNDTRD